VTALGDYAFAGNGLTSVTVPPSVTAIGTGAFYDNPLTHLAIPANVDIKVSSFNGLLYAHYTGGGKNAAVYEFSRSRDGGFGIIVCNKTLEIAGYWGTAAELVLPEEINGLPVIAIGGWAFEENQLTGVTIPSSVTAIGDRAFAGNNLTSVTIPDGVTAIGDYGFTGNQLTGVTIPPSVTAIGDRAFVYNPLTSVTISANVTVENNYTFPGDFAKVYRQADRQAGTYTSGDDGKTWARQ
jgi:hypothetical protein